MLYAPESYSQKSSILFGEHFKKNDFQYHE